MRVLFVTHNFPRFSGDLPGNFLLRLALALRTIGVDVHVLAPHAIDLADTEKVDGIPVTRFHYAPELRETLAYTGTMAAQVKGSFRAKVDLVHFIRSATRAIRRHALPVDVVHAQWWFPAGLSASRGALNGRPLVTTLHGSDVRFARSGLARSMMRRVLKRSTRVTAVSTWLSSEAQRMSGVTPVVAPMPVEAESFTPSSVTRTGLLFVGKLDAQKGASVLIEAMPLLPSEVTLTIVGDGPDSRALHARVATLGIAGRVRWTGALPHADLPRFYQHAELFVAPATEAEGLGLTAAEALLCETPVIASNIGGIPDIVQDGETGRLITPRDPRVLADAIVTALRDPARAEWGREGRARLRARFAPEACAARYAAVYEEAMRARA